MMAQNTSPRKCGVYICDNPARPSKNTIGRYDHVCSDSCAIIYHHLFCKFCRNLLTVSDHLQNRLCTTCESYPKEYRDIIHYFFEPPLCIRFGCNNLAKKKRDSHVYDTHCGLRCKIFDHKWFCKCCDEKLRSHVGEAAKKKLCDSCFNNSSRLPKRCGCGTICKRMANANYDTHCSLRCKISHLKLMCTCNKSLISHRREAFQFRVCDSCYKIMDN